MTTSSKTLLPNKRNNKFWKVVARGGHVGAGNAAELIFYIEAPDALRANDAVRRFPAVKHHKNNAILKIVEITEEEYLENLSGYSAYDRYNNRDRTKENDRK